MFWLDSCHHRKDFELILLLFSLMTPAPLSFQGLEMQEHLHKIQHTFLFLIILATHPLVCIINITYYCVITSLLPTETKKVTFKIIGFKYPQPSNLTFLLYHSNVLAYSLVLLLYTFTYVQQSQSLLWAKMTKLITEDKLNCCNKIVKKQKIYSFLQGDIQQFH